MNLGTVKIKIKFKNNLKILKSIYQIFKKQNKTGFSANCLHLCSICREPQEFRPIKGKHFGNTGLAPSTHKQYLLNR